MAQGTPEQRFHDIKKASIIMMVSLILPHTWNLIPSDFIWTFWFFDNSTNGYSFDPSEYRSYPFNAIIPFYQFIFMVPLYIYCRGLVHQMHVTIKGINIDVWFLYSFYFGLQAIHLMLAFLQFPHYRMVMTVIIIFMHIKFLIKLQNESS